MILDYIFRYLRWRKAIKFIRKFPKRPIVCDIGCGLDGGFLEKISNFINFGFGFDKKVTYSEHLKIELKKIDLEKENIPLKEKTVDIVTSLAVLEHLKDPSTALREIFRILKPNGFLILTTPGPKAEYPLLWLVRLKLVDKEPILEHKKYYSLKELKQLFLGAGFQKENIILRYFEFSFNILAVAKK